MSSVLLIDMTTRKLKKHGYLPRMSTMSKIIYDKDTSNMYGLSFIDNEHYNLIPFRHFSGFSRAGRTDTNEEWDDKYYVLFRLAKPCLNATDWAEDTEGWTW
jgi:hypothetical protein